MTRTTIGLIALMSLALATESHLMDSRAAQPAASIAAKAKGIAAMHLGDVGIHKDPDVVFSDDFESWAGDGTIKPPDKWHGLRKNKTSRTRAVPGKVALAGGPGPGNRVLEIACWHEKGKSQTGGVSLKLGNYNHRNEGLGDGYDELYVRYYIKFDEDYRGVRNHGSNLGGRDLTSKNPAWVGMAAIRDVSSRGYFYSGLQPYGERGSRELEMGFYSYHLDKKGPWGDRYEVQKKIPIRVGTWYCVERRMKLNSVDAATSEANRDGLEELWIDGERSIRRERLRFRKTPRLKITLFSFETYYHGLPEEFGEGSPARVFFDNVVVAKQYIGPIVPGTAARRDRTD